MTFNNSFQPKLFFDSLIQSSGIAERHSRSSSSRHPAARTRGLMDLYPGTSLPEIVKLEQVQRGAANAIRSWSELGGEVEGAEPAGLDKLWQGRSCPRHPGSASTRQRGGYSSGNYFARRGQDTGDRESHQGTKGRQGNTQETKNKRNHNTS